jgi:putative tryptophan/tyrosine transport system substrate-binding protein
MGRRDFISLVAGAATWPLGARAQRLGKLPTIGFLGPTTLSASSDSTAAFVQRLRELGWIEGRTVTTEYRWTEGRNERAAEFAAEFVRLNVDVIVTAGTSHIVAAKQATSVIPIVFAAAADPVGAGLVRSLAQPGANVTGLSLQTADLAGKRLELVREVLPDLRRLGIVVNNGNLGAMLDTRQAEAAARTLGLDVTTQEIQRAEDVASAVAALKGRVDALYLVDDPLTFLHRVNIISLALDARLPTVHSFREYVKAGGMMSYGPNFLNLWRRAAEYGDKILRGTKPADIPVEQPTKFDLVINLTTAKALGLNIPEAFLLRADEIIE